MIKFFCWVLIFLIWVPSTYSFTHPKIRSKHWTKKYDSYFRKYTKRNFGVGFDWRWFKAQAIAESNLNNQAKSWVGAKGLMQIMPRTFSDIQKKNPSFRYIQQPRWNIAAGIYYNRHIYSRWSHCTFFEQMKYMFASYNAGLRTIRRAESHSKKIGFQPCYWNNVEKISKKVRRWREKETLNYVKKIFFIMN